MASATGTGSATVVRSSLPMRSSAVSAASASARHVQHSSEGRLTYVTVLSTKTDPEAAHGVLGLHRSLRRVRSAHPLLCLCVNVSNETQSALQSDGIHVRDVAPIEAGHPGAFGKLQVLQLLDYRRVLFLDVDTIVLRNIDHLFELQCDFAFAPDIGFEVSASKMDLINAGVFVHTPQDAILKDMMQHKEGFTTLSGEPFLQDFINAHRETLDGRMSICDLDVMYNVKRQLFLGHPQLWNCVRQEVAVMQFGGRQKPWHVTSTFSSGSRAGHGLPETTDRSEGGKSVGSSAGSAGHLASGGKPGGGAPKVHEAAPTSGNAGSAASEHGKPTSGELESSASGSSRSAAQGGDSKKDASTASKAAVHETARGGSGSHATRTQLSNVTAAGAAAPHTPGSRPKAADSEVATAGREPAGSPSPSHVHSVEGALQGDASKHGAAMRRVPPTSPSDASIARPPAAPPTAPVHGAARTADESASNAGRRSLDATSKQAHAPRDDIAHAPLQPRPTSNDPLFGIWWVLFEERRLREMPLARHTANVSEIEAANEAAFSSCAAASGVSCPSRSENCIHRYLARRSFSLSAAEWQALPAMVVGLAVATLWLILLLVASVCPQHALRRAESGFGVDDAQRKRRRRAGPDQHHARVAGANPRSPSYASRRGGEDARNGHNGSGAGRGGASEVSSAGQGYERVPPLPVQSWS